MALQGFFAMASAPGAGTLPAAVLRSRYVMSSTDVGSLANLLCPCYGMSGTELGSPAPRIQRFRVSHQEDRRVRVDRRSDQPATHTRCCYTVYGDGVCLYLISQWSVCSYAVLLCPRYAIPDRAFDDVLSIGFYVVIHYSALKRRFVLWQTRRRDRRLR